MKFISILHRFWDGFWPHFRWFFDEFPVRAFTLHEASRSLFLNNSMVFCAQNQGFTLSEKLESPWFSWSFSIPILISILIELRHRFRFHFGSLFVLFSMFFRDRFLNEFSMVFLKGFGPKWVPKLSQCKPPPPSQEKRILFRKGFLLMILVPFWSPFWYPFGWFGFPFGRFGLSFGTCWLTCAPFWSPFGLPSWGKQIRWIQIWLSKVAKSPTN